MKKKAIVYTPDRGEITFVTEMTTIREITIHDKCLHIFFEDKTLLVFCGMPFEYIEYQSKTDEQAVP